MSITSKATHAIEDGLESYEFPSEVNEKYRHLVDRIDDGPWTIWPVERFEPMTLDEARTFVQEVGELIEFAENLTRTSLRRATEPGEPDLAGRGGGL